MKKNVFIISLILIIIFILIIVVCLVGINSNLKKKEVIKQQNTTYEKYLENEIYGTDVITLINKATNNNESNNVTKDEKGFYINNNQNSIQIDLVMITDEQEQETTTYKMEAISKVGITGFIKNFNTEKFECTKIEYHKETGRISYIELSQK